jgi:glycogen debranching enzyme
VDSITSNPGHCLWARLIDDEHAAPTVEQLTSDSMLTEWGIRTMTNTEPAYNPFSYHDGSIWPWENAFIASGLKKYGFVTETQAVLEALIDASRSFEYRRWPEVYCGVSKPVGGVLARQPDASRPQAWSAGAIFLFVQTILGMAPLPFSKRVYLTPALPTCFREVVVDNVQVAGGRLGVRLVRDGSSVLMEIRDNPDDLEIVVLPVHRNHRPTGDNVPATSK